LRGVFNNFPELSNYFQPYHLQGEKIMKKVHWSVLLAAMALLIILVPVLAQEEGEDTLTIMHTNDVHARVLQLNKYGGTCDDEAAAAGECFGGVARRMTMIDEIRGEGGNSILVDAGDEFQGTLFYNMYKGAEAAQFMTALGYDAMAVGNHEFDDGPEGLADFINSVDFPVVSANIDASADADLAGLIVPYAVLDVNGQQIGVVGYTTEDTEILSSPGDDVVFNNIDTAVADAIAELEGMGINKIVALSHAGYGRDQDLAAVTDGIDVIVGGHTHSLLSNDDEDADGPYPTVVNSPNGDPVLIVSAESYGKYLGRLDVAFDENGVPSSWDGGPILLDASVEEDPEILAQAMELDDPLEELRTELIGVADVDLDGDRDSCRFGECTMGDLIADSVVWGTEAQGTQIVILNGGGIRAGIGAGDISVGDVLEVLPFGNLISTFGLTGADVVAALENGVSRAENPDNEGTGRFAQVSGLRYSWDGSQPEGERIVSVEVMGEDGSYTEIDPEAVYQVASNDFMRGGGDGYSVFEENGIDAYDYGPTLDEVLVSYIKEMSPVAPELEGRITRVDEEMAADEGEEAAAGDEAAAGVEMAPETLPVTGSAPSSWPVLALVLLVVATLFGSDVVRRKRSA